jgi:hypothetical protein
VQSGNENEKALKQRQMTSLSQPLLSARRPTELHARRSRTLFVAGLCALILLLLTHFVTIGRQASWQDEIFFVSTGWSLAQSKPPIMSVMAQYPRTDSPIQFYGPVSFEVDAQLIRTLGLSLVAWRRLCFGGVVLTILLSSSLVKLAGGDKWAQLITALIIGLAESVGSTLPGRFDTMTSALFLAGLLFLLRGVEVGGRALTLGVVLGGLSIGVALGSTPRSLTLSLAAAITALVAVRFPKLRKRFLFGTGGVFVIAALTQTLLFLPWGMNSLSWYAYVRRATKGDAINATSVAGQGTLDFDLRWHKSVLIIFLLLLLLGLLGALARRGRERNREKIPFRLFLTLFAALNLSLMLLLLAQALGQSPYWLPPVVIAAMSWFDWGLLKAKALGPLASGLVGACLLILVFQNAQSIASVFLTWNRRSNAELFGFVRRTVQPGAVVYGPVSGYFYPVELAGSTYLYLSEQARAGRYSEPHASIADKLEEEICARPAFAMWPESDPKHHPEAEPMPQVLRERLLPKVGELNQPPLSLWRERVLDRLGPIGGKYGFPDVAIYPLRALRHCGKG